MDHLNGVGPQALNGKYHCTADLLPSFCLELAALLRLNEQPFYLFGQIQTSQTGGHPYSDTSLSGFTPPENYLTFLLNQPLRTYLPTLRMSYFRED